MRFPRQSELLQSSHPTTTPNDAAAETIANAAEKIFMFKMVSRDGCCLLCGNKIYELNSEEIEVRRLIKPTSTDQQETQPIYLISHLTIGKVRLKEDACAKKNERRT